MQELLYELLIFFKDEEQPTEYEYFTTWEEAEKRKEDYLQNKDSWFCSEQIEAIYINKKS